VEGIPEYGLEFLGGHFQLNSQVERVVFQLYTSLLKPVCGVTSSISFWCQKVNQEKDFADSKEKDEEWQFENEQ
jgi:hypothetical protein